MRTSLVLALTLLSLAAAAPLRGMDMVPREEPVRAREDRPIGPHVAHDMGRPEGLMARAEELEREAHGLLERAGGEEIEHRARRLMAEAEALRQAAEQMATRQRLFSTTISEHFRPEPPPAVLVPSGDMHEEEADALAEDMAVMAKLLERVARNEMGDQPAGWPAADFAQPALGAQQPGSLYLQGYGMVFFLRVPFALSGPVAPQRDEQPEEPNSLWEQTRRELRMAPPGADMAHTAPMPGIDSDVLTDVPGGRFRPEAVERLKRTLLDALEHAANIRGLKGKESVAIVVLGSGRRGQVGSGFTVRLTAPGVPGAYGPTDRPADSILLGDPGAYGDRPHGRDPHRMVVARHPGTAGTTAMTVHVTKSDIDDLAADRIDIEEFADRATVTIR